MCQALKDIMRDDFAKVEEKAIKTGSDQKAREDAKGFREAGIDPAIIAKVTGLSATEIAAL